MYRYNAKLVLHNREGEKLFPCTHLEVKNLKDMDLSDPDDPQGVSPSSPIIGLQIELCPDGPIFELPRDGESVYVTNAATGANVEAYHWPRRVKPVPQPV